MTRSIVFSILLAVGLILASCEKPDCGCKTSQPVLFQYEYVNHAWGYRHHGFLIDENGKVHGFQLPEEWKEPDSLGMISKPDLQFNLAQCDTVSGEVEKMVLDANFGKIKDIRNGKIVDYGTVMADAGTGVFSAWYWNETAGKYESVFLISNGDFYKLNTHADVKGVVDWLIKVGETSGRFYWYGGK